MRKKGEGAEQETGISADKATHDNAQGVRDMYAQDIKLPPSVIRAIRELADAIVEEYYYYKEPAKESLYQVLVNKLSLIVYEIVENELP